MKAEYLGGAWKPADFIDSGLPEICFLGRSNVGKSSLINTVVNRKRLAKVSSTPGRTQAIHFFSVADSFCLVDFPGYGYAKAPDAVRRTFAPLVDAYLSGRKALAGGLLLVDCRREPRQDEFDLVQRFRDNNVPLLLVVTKTDKLAKSRRTGRIAQLRAKVGVAKAVGFSTLNKEGRDGVRNWIDARIR